MKEIYKQAFEIQSEMPEIEFHYIVNLIRKYGYNQTLIQLLSE